MLRPQQYIAAVAIAALTLNAVFKVTALYWLAKGDVDSRKISVVDNTHNGLWDIVKRPVQLQLDYALRYGLESSLEWEALVPGDGLIYLGEDHQPYAVSMLHQMHCLDTIRQQLAKRKEDRDLDATHRCMNYIRQMVLCRSDTFLDPFQYPSKIDPVDSHPVRACLDWEAVYSAVVQNQRSHSDWLRYNATDIQ